ncbi:ester cyclase [Actinokineospora auranticolor]|uniref:SnoaL-like polyketide cyclase n=1 Tax=Actinokineospora auranticolor TaxID=155976 RepID=A0A2S6GFU6_9PSEU|nr:ester cyclase [Actinokineospora auranticolor]PPK64093.1 SnoaL-like polyketide cyclase [Actinokineospora auranticolor]
MTDVLLRAPEVATSADDQVEIAIAFVRETLNEGDYAVLDSFAHPDIRDLSDVRVFDDGIAGLRFSVAAARRAMPDIYARIVSARRTGPDTVETRLEVSGTYVGSNLAPSQRQGRRATWRQHHLWSFRGARACAHLGWVDSAALRAALGDPY